MSKRGLNVKSYKRIRRLGTLKYFQKFVWWKENIDKTIYHWIHFICINYFGRNSWNIQFFCNLEFWLELDQR